MQRFLLVLICLLVTPYTVYANEMERSVTDYLLLNISRADSKPGAVVASPSKNNPDYYYHWVRDAALVMNTVLNQYLRSQDGSEKAHLKSKYQQYIDWVNAVQKEPTPSGNLAEPKFYVDGKAYTGPWGRPQSDGPALRAMTLARYASHLIEIDASMQEVEQLYNNHYPADSLIKTDLEYVSQHWLDQGFDLWEEISGLHFYNLTVQKAALVSGATLAQKLGDPGAAAWYRYQADAIQAKLIAFWDSENKYYRSTIRRNGGIDYKHSGLDIAIVLALLHTKDINGTSQFLDDKIQSTVLKLVEANRNLYSINHNNQPGIAIGRYPEDRYDGYGNSIGNPWNLATLALGEYYFGMIDALIEAKQFHVTALNQKFYEMLLAKTSHSKQNGLVPGTTITENDEEFMNVTAALVQAGQQQMQRVLYHANPAYHLSEQMNRETGYQQGAPDLTWSYAAVLSHLAACQNKSDCA